LASAAASVGSAYMQVQGMTSAMGAMQEAGGGNMDGAVRNLNTSADQLTTSAKLADMSPGFATLASQRNKATVASKDVFCTMTAIEVDGSPKRSGMVKVNKDTGAELGRILLKDLTPVYIQDDVENMLYVIVDNNNFYCYKLQ
jgi:hypothetical protein